MTAIEALAELIALKDMKDEVLRLKQRRIVAIKRDPQAVEEVKRLEDEYNRRKPLAWSVGRAIVAASRRTRAGEDTIEAFCEREGLNEPDNDTGLSATFRDIAHKAWNAAAAARRPVVLPRASKCDAEACESGCACPGDCVAG